MREVQTTEAGARWTELLQAVEYGETVAIMRHGKAIAHLVPAHDQERAARKAAVERFRAWRRQRRPVSMTTEEILAAIREGRQ